MERLTIRRIESGEAAWFYDFKFLENNSERVLPFEDDLVVTSIMRCINMEGFFRRMAP